MLAATAQRSELRCPSRQWMPCPPFSGYASSTLRVWRPPPWCDTQGRQATSGRCRINWFCPLAHPPGGPSKKSSPKSTCQRCACWPCPPSSFSCYASSTLRVWRPRPSCQHPRDQRRKCPDRTRIKLEHHADPRHPSAAEWGSIWCSPSNNASSITNHDWQQPSRHTSRKATCGRIPRHSSWTWTRRRSSRNIRTAPSSHAAPWCPAHPLSCQASSTFRVWRPLPRWWWRWPESRIKIRSKCAANAIRVHGDFCKAPGSQTSEAVHGRHLHYTRQTDPCWSQTWCLETPDCPEVIGRYSFAFGHATAATSVCHAEWDHANPGQMPFPLCQVCSRCQHAGPETALHQVWSTVESTSLGCQRWNDILLGSNSVWEHGQSISSHRFCQWSSCVWVGRRMVVHCHWSNRPWQTMVFSCHCFSPLDTHRSSPRQQQAQDDHHTGRVLLHSCRHQVSSCTWNDHWSFSENLATSIPRWLWFPSTGMDHCNDQWSWARGNPCHKGWTVATSFRAGTLQREQWTWCHTSLGHWRYQTWCQRNATIDRLASPAWGMAREN